MKANKASEITITLPVKAEPGTIITISSKKPFKIVRPLIWTSTLLLLFVCSLCKAQTNFLGATGTIIRNATSTTFTNSTTSDQALFSSTIPANTMTTDRPYAFSVDLTISTPVLPPTISFDIKLGSNTMVLANGATLVGSLTGATGLITISGYVVKRASGKVFCKFLISPSGTTSVLGLTTTNSINAVEWTVDTTIDEAFSVNVSFSATGSTTTVTRQMYVRSDF